MRKIKIGDFVQYTKDPKDVIGCYGLVFRMLNFRSWISNFQVVWFGEKQRRGKYDISGAIYRKNRKDCKFVAKPPKRILKRVSKALSYVVECEKEYREPDKFTNLDLIEVLAKVRKLI